jgi:hypothetical protein
MFLSLKKIFKKFINTLVKNHRIILILILLIATLTACHQDACPGF